MKCPSCLLTPVLAIVGLGVLGFGGYNYATSGCPLGSCGKSDASTKVTTVANTPSAESTGCPGSGDCASCPNAGSCPEAGACGAGSCSEKGKAEQAVCPFSGQPAIKEASDKSQGHCPSSGSCTPKVEPATQAEEKTDGAN